LRRVYAIPEPPLAIYRSVSLFCLPAFEIAVSGKRDPSGMTLTHDIGLASLPLCVERIEFLLEALVGRFSGVDRAADGEPGFA
jgi:hypothetical protein